MNWGVEYGESEGGMSDTGSCSGASTAGSRNLYRELVLVAGGEEKMLSGSLSDIEESPALKETWHRITDKIPPSYNREPGECKAEFAISVSHGVDTHNWITDAHSTIDEINTCQVFERLAIFMAAAAALSILPVVMPLGDWTDISKRGYVNQLGYFVWYTGTGWATLWTVWAVWAARILERPVPIFGTIVLPTLFAIVLFFTVHVIVGGPFPLGTVSLGAFCFLMEFACLWVFLLRSHEDGFRMLMAYVAWLGLLLVYFGITITMKRIPWMSHSIAALFPFLGEICARFRLEDFMFHGREHTDDQSYAVNLFKLNYVALHATYSSFLFPVLADLRSVATAVIIGLLLHLENLYRSLEQLDDDEWRGKAAANKLAQSLSCKAYILFGKLVSPILFATLITFECYSFNHGMFYTFDKMSQEQHQQCLLGIFISFLGGVLSILTGVLYFRWWMRINMHDDEDGACVEAGDGVLININRYTVVRTLHLLKERTIDRLFDFSTLLWMTFGANTTIVGVCMVMKHDGMDIDGWMGFLLDKAGMPYPLCPIWSTTCLPAFHTG
eukprot:TRINITY_DN29244_c0_g3_i2.p1 TRINITY_DN29244_c0_g3~~TRINITY_DN29244_c0_g3_i2.p1  ORF type:complete len:556 (+),score=48.06 TRINITY_DN29244_c0_g3_i2:88-1755(+)